MSEPAPIPTTATSITEDTLVTVKVSCNDASKKILIKFKDLGPQKFPNALRAALSIPPEQNFVVERFSDSVGAYTALDQHNSQAYKTLYRAAKAKLKLRLRVTVLSDTHKPEQKQPQKEEHKDRKQQEPKQKGEKQQDEEMQNSIRQRKVLQEQLIEQQMKLLHLKPPLTKSTFEQVGEALKQNVPTTSENTSAAVSAQPTFSCLTGCNLPMPQHEKLNSDRMVAWRGYTANNTSEKNEAPVPEPFEARKEWSPLLPTLPSVPSLSQGLQTTPAVQAKKSSLCSWSVYCNACGKPMPDAHYHCNICEDGDYDLCEICVAAGQHCPGEGHWLIKRSVINGNFVSSVTEKVAPKAKKFDETEKEAPESLAPQAEKIVKGVDDSTLRDRACNSCIMLFSDDECITCTTCKDFDLCIGCQIENKHGHHPAHTFEPVNPKLATPLVELLCSSSRGVSHAAYCDGCDKKIVGVRHKCFECPDWDYCSECFKSAEYIHPKHRFATVYDPLPIPRSRSVRHFGIYCDGPLCKDTDENQSYIRGIRYKCVICNDKDFCANCEASPSNDHNKTHPLMKFKTPVRNVSVMTSGEDRRGVSMPQMGDLRARHVAAAKAAAAAAAAAAAKMAPSVNAATQVQGEIDAKRNTELSKKPVKEKIEIKDLLAEPIKEKISTPEMPAVKDCSQVSTITPKERTAVPTSALQAHYVDDVIADGTRVAPGAVFCQMWALVNPGPHSWPAGCSVRYVGGDNMLNIDTNQPSTAGQVAAATESNVLEHEVPCSRTRVFSVTMRAPLREGRAISYWRVKGPDGTPFGHRLWCDINVDAKTRPFSARPYSTRLTKNADSKDSCAVSQQGTTYKVPLSSNGGAAPEGDKVDLSQQMRDNFMREVVKKRHPRMLIDRKTNDIVSGVQILNAWKSPSPVTPVVSKEPASGAEIVKETVTRQEVQSTSESSKMIFPQLDKESPAASIHEKGNEDTSATMAKSAVASDASSSKDTTSTPIVQDAPRGEVASEAASDATATSTTEVAAERDLFEDAESVTLDDSDDETFLTDEEYDILDASDEELA